MDDRPMAEEAGLLTCRALNTGRRTNRCRDAGELLPLDSQR